MPRCGFWPGTVCAFPHYPCVLVAGSCDETDPEYELRFDADEEYIRELIGRIDEMSLREVKRCNRCTEKHPGKWQGKRGKAQCAECDRNVARHFVLRKAAARGAEDEPRYRVKPKKSPGLLGWQSTVDTTLQTFTFDDGRLCMAFGSLITGKEVLLVRVHRVYFPWWAIYRSGGGQAGAEEFQLQAMVIDHIERPDEKLKLTA